MAEIAKISDLIRVHPFNDLFPIDPKIKAAIKEHIETFSYDDGKPVDVWQEKMIVLDGNTRIEAATEAGMVELPVHYHSFRNEGEALEYAIHNQRDRRNFTDADIYRCVKAVDEVKQRGGDRKSQTYQESKASSEAIEKSKKEEKSASKTAKTTGVSRVKVEKVRTIDKIADPETRKEVEEGKKTINKAYQETIEKKKAIPKSSAIFNLTNDNIEWAKWTWNPVTGCLHGCKYCYARDISNRYWPETEFKPEFHPNRLAAPKNTAIPSHLIDAPGIKNVFVCSMADLFGEWVPKEWIDSVLDVVRDSPQWTYLFLTKNPIRLIEIDWPDNAWVGTTVDTQRRVKPVEDIFREVKAPVKFLSCEPLLEELTFSDLSMFDWLIIGSRSKNSQLPAFQPEWAWVESLFNQARKAGLKVYFKPNLTIRPREYPLADLCD